MRQTSQRRAPQQRASTRDASPARPQTLDLGLAVTVYCAASGKVLSAAGLDEEPLPTPPGQASTGFTEH